MTQTEIMWALRIPGLLATAAGLIADVDNLFWGGIGWWGAILVAHAWTAGASR